MVIIAKIVVILKLPCKYIMIINFSPTISPIIMDDYLKSNVQQFLFCMNAKERKKIKSNEIRRSPFSF